MGLRQVFRLEGSETALVQNRLNIAALALTALVFSGTFGLGLSSQLRPPSDFRSSFVHLLVPIAIGVIASMASIFCFLQSQESEEAAPADAGSTTPSAGAAGRPLYRARHWWFCLGQLALYISLAEALSASLTEVVYGVWRSSRILGLSIAVAAVPVWWSLLFVGPATLIYRMFWRRTGFLAVAATYVCALVAVLLAMAAGYQARGGGTLMSNFVDQLYHPWTWASDWNE